MKKILLIVTLLFTSAVSLAQWQPHNPSGLIRDTAGMHILITQDWLDIQGMYWVDVIRNGKKTNVTNTITKSKLWQVQYTQMIFPTSKCSRSGQRKA